MKKSTFMAIVTVVIIAIVVCVSSCSSSGKRSSSSSKKDGFYGSDGKYHEYVPEFGDDVNKWMEENW